MATTQTVSTPAITASGRQPLRLTRRGRLTVLIVVALAVLVLGSWRAMSRVPVPRVPVPWRSRSSRATPCGPSRRPWRLALTRGC